MRILIATGIFPPDVGGPAIYVQSLAEEFIRQGVRIVVLTYSDQKSKQDYTFPVIRISRQYPKGIRHFLYSLKLLSLARAADVIYAQNPVSAGLPAALAAKILGKKLVLKVVGDAVWERARSRGREVEDMKILKKLQKWTAKSADKIIVPSFYLKNMVQQWGIPEKKIKVVYNAVETKKQVPERIDIKGDIILSIGRLVPWKGFDALIEIIPDLIKENPNFRLLIVGEGEERKNLELKIDNLKLKDRVRLMGRVDHSDISFYFRAADIFILNSEYEGLSHTILEAMQYGIPVIASNKGGNPELIKDGFNGFLIEYDNQEQLKRAILKLWRDKNLQKRFTHNSKKKLKQFSFEKMIEKTLEVLKT